MAIQALIGLGLAGYGAYKGYQDGKKQEKLEDRALRQREMEYGQRAPMRRQGMQALGQVEAPMDLGNLGFNPANPFAAARGRAPSTASYGDWGRMTTSPEATDRALGGMSEQQIADDEAMLAAQYIGKSDGKMRFASAPGGREFTNSDRQGAIDRLKQYDQNVGFARPRAGMQPLGGGR